MKPIYDSIGTCYSVKRQTDPDIAKLIYAELKGAKNILNIGAGTGSYEPKGVELTALEPSQKMIDQRPPDSHPVIQGSAESIPFADNSFSHCMTVLSMHHWSDRPKSFDEICRVATEKFVAVSWNPNSEPFWLTRDYFPEIVEADRVIFPDIKELTEHFDDLTIEPLLIPAACIDGFLAAYWKRPEAYLDKDVRASISTFSKLENISSGLSKLRSDLDSGKWHNNNREILDLTSLDVGYILITGTPRSS